MANLGRYTFTTAQTSLIIRQVYQFTGAMATNNEWYVMYGKDGIEYTDIIGFAASADQTLLNTALTSGQYYTFDLTPGATTNDPATGANVVLN